MKVKVLLSCDCLCPSCAHSFRMDLSQYPAPGELDRVKVDCPRCHGREAFALNAYEPEEEIYHEFED